MTIADQFPELNPAQRKMLLRIVLEQVPQKKPHFYKDFHGNKLEDLPNQAFNNCIDEFTINLKELFKDEIL
jgi:hypothetical protein